MPYKDPAKRREWEINLVLSGRKAEYDARHAPRRKSWGNTNRQRKLAHNLMRKYGMTLAQAEKIGVIPPDVQEALNGNR